MKKTAVPITGSCEPKTDAQKGLMLSPTSLHWITIMSPGPGSCWKQKMGNLDSPIELVKHYGTPKNITDQKNCLAYNLLSFVFDAHRQSYEDLKMKLIGIYIHRNLRQFVFSNLFTHHLHPLITNLCRVGL